MYERILIPTDGSDVARPAIESALDLAATYDATLHVLNVVDQPRSVSGVGEGFSGLDNLLDELEDVGERATGRIADEANDHDIETETAIRRGDAKEDIIEYANEHEIDCIVMSTHGRTGVKRALLGSVTEAVVRHSEIPVLTVHAEPEE